MLCFFFILFNSIIYYNYIYGRLKNIIHNVKYKILKLTK